MKVLGIDTTAGVASVAITEGGKALSSFTLDSGNTHSVTLLPMIETSLKVLGLTTSDISLYAVSAGPGSFTGVRIGAATVKGLAFADDTPCVGVSSLEAMAENLRGLSGIICPVINARGGRVYTALFKPDGAKVPKRLTDDDTLPLEELCSLLSEFKDEDIYFVGDAYEIAKEKIQLDAVKETPLAIRAQNAVGVALLGERKFREATGEERERMTAENLSVIYLRQPQAEREREERLAAGRDLAKGV